MEALLQLKGFLLYTSMVGKLFAPIMLTWFLILAGLGLRSIIANPEVLHALNPMWAVHFFLSLIHISVFSATPAEWR